MLQNFQSFLPTSVYKFLHGSLFILHLTIMAQAGEKTFRVLVDMDMVLCDFERHLLAEFQRRHPKYKFIPLEKRRGFYAKDQYYASFGEESSAKISNIYKEKDFFMNLSEIPGAIEAIIEMDKMEGVDVYICSSPMISCNTCLTEKADWIEKYLGRKWVEKLILVKDKTLINADVLIDDRPDITGANKTPHWEHVVLTACHNVKSDIGGKKRLNDWKDNSWRELISNLNKLKIDTTGSRVNTEILQ